MVVLSSFIGACLFFGGAWLWWQRIVGFNRRFVGRPRNQFQRRGEQANRWFGTAFLTVAGMLVLSVGVRAALGS